MDFDLTDYRLLMVQSFATFLANECRPARVRAADDTGGYDEELWSRFVDLGGPTVSLAERHGGGGDLIDAVLVGFECGRRVAPIGYADAVGAIRLMATVSDRPRATGLIGGAPITLAPGWATRARISGDRIDGSVGWTRNGAVASWLLIPADGQLALVDLGAPGARREPQANLGRFPMAGIHLDEAEIVECWPADEIKIRQSLYEHRLLCAAELIGAGRQALALAVAHVLERRQFDQAIGSFQAVQHRLADRHTALDGAELLALRAAAHGDDLDALRWYSALVTLRAADAAELAAKESLQFFGGYGFTLEYDVHLYLRFAKSLSVLANDPWVVDDALAVHDTSGGGGGGAGGTGREVVGGSAPW
jgi:alkylation response protein AidB-like acyl-CoA dehydrogenase